MSVTSFVSGSALLLALWLGVTFFHEVSPLDNPNLPQATAAAATSPDTAAPAPASTEPAAGPATPRPIGEP